MAETNAQGARPKVGRREKLVIGALLLAVAVFAAAMAVAGLGKGLGGIPAEQLKTSDVIFWAIAAMVVASAAGVAFSRNIIYSALSLLGALLGAGGLYVFLDADFVAITQLLIYVGGVLVLILFAVMLTSRIGGEGDSNPRTGVALAVPLLAALLAVLGYAALKAPWKLGAPFSGGPSAVALGDAFLGPYLLPFEVASLVLLATLVGAVVVARKEIKE